MVDPVNQFSSAMVFGIVTYQEKFYECESFLTLLQSYRSKIRNERLNVIIIDNTDDADWNLDSDLKLVDVHVTYINLQNPGISVAYNTINSFALENKFKWMIFLDQDTELPQNAYDVYKNASQADEFLFPVKIPIIYSSGRILSPARYIAYRSKRLSKDPEPVLNIDDVSWINSGMMASTVFFSRAGGYNEKLKLDFCDHDFVEKIKKHLSTVQILDLKLVQNFSATDHNKSQSLIRFKIFQSDLKEFYQTRNKSKVFIFVDMPHVLKLSVKFRTADFIRMRWSG